MKEAEAIKSIITSFEFECPNCKRSWVLSSDTLYTEEEHELFYDLNYYDQVDVNECKCGTSFIAKTTKGTEL